MIKSLGQNDLPFLYLLALDFLGMLRYCRDMTKRLVCPPCSCETQADHEWAINAGVHHEWVVSNLSATVKTTNTDKE